MVTINYEAALGTLEDNADLIREYWRDLRAAWDSCEASLRRTVFYIGVLAMAFWLVVTHGLDDVTFLGLKVNDLGFVEILVPPIVGYLVWVACSMAALTVRLQIVHDEIALHYWPRFADEGLDLFVRPVAGIANSVAISYKLPNKLVTRGTMVAAVARFFALLGLPIIFEVYAITEVVIGDAGNIIVRTTCVALSLLFLVASVPVLMAIHFVTREDGSASQAAAGSSDTSDGT